MEKEIYQPKTLMDAIKHFADINNCFAYLIPIRWPNGITCPNCESTEHSFLSTRHIWKCKACKKQFSIKQGTIMEDSPLGYDKWMCAVWLIANAKNGISSYEIHRAIGVTQKSAWFMLHRIRLAMKTGSFLKMSGTIETDETFVGGKAKNMHKDKREAVIKGRGAVGKAIVMGLLERGDKEAGKVSQMKAMVVANRSAETLQGVIRENVETGSHVMTDEWTGYDGLNADYIHSVINHSVKYAEDGITTNGAENFWTLFKRCIKGTYVSVEADHLEAYIDEEVFRFNERDGKDNDRFVTALQGISGRRITYKELTATEDGLGRRGEMPRIK